MQTDSINFFPNTPRSANGPSGQMGRNDFLNLLVTQLQHQNPLEPMRNEAFVAQLAQFSSLEQLVNINDSLTGLRMLESSINNSQAVNLIGRNITVFGNTIKLEDGQATRGSFVLNAAADEVTVTVLDSDGAQVRSIELGSKAAGDHEFIFDGKDDEGLDLPDGEYTFTISAVGEEGETMIVTSFVDVLVEGLTFRDGYVYLLAGGQKYLLSEIVEVRGG